ncbi:ino eighty subunit 1 [Monosporozyma unispora]|nr:hypothetical protein C6P44_005174 [Kazachstania unispora]
MGGRVYDPIHDVFQDTEPVRAEPAVTSNTVENNNNNNTTVDSSNKNKNEINSDTAPASAPSAAEIAPVSREESNLGNVEPSLIADQYQEQEQETENDSYSSANNTASNISNGTKHRRFTTKFNRHVKKQDGDYVTRKELQYSFFKELLSDKREVFTNIFYKEYTNMLVPFRDLYDDQGHVQIMNVTDKEFDARRFFSHEKLTFSQLYVLCLATSSKSSKILREKLLADHFMAFATCMLALLVNVGRLNTTINFSPEMTSQLRIFHSIPCLQCISPDEKSLQDTPRLKSILRNLPLGNGAIDLEKLSQNKETPSDEQRPIFNVINMIFTLCDSPTFIKELLFRKDNFCGDLLDLHDEQFEINNIKNHHGYRGDLSIYTFLDSTKYTIKCRITVVLWVLYILLETNLSEKSISDSLNIFGERQSDGEYRIKLKLDKDGKDPDNHDVDTEKEIEYGNILRERRKVFLKKKNLSLNNEKIMSSPPKARSPKVSSPRAVKTETELPKRKRKRRQLVQVNPDSGSNTRIMMDSTADDYTLFHPITNEDEDDVITIPVNKNEEEQKPLVDQTKVQQEDKKSVNANGDVHYATFLPMATPNPQQMHFSPGRNQRNRINANTPDDPHVFQINNLIKDDKARKIIGNKTQDDVITELIPIHDLLKLRRKEIGILKLFNEYENIPIAPALGVRGKKRKRYDDGYMGFETDYLKMFAQCKQLLLKQDIENKEFEEDKKDTFRL